MTLILRALAHPGEGMWVEDPGFPPIRPVVAQERIELMPVAVDADGLMSAPGSATTRRRVLYRSLPHIKAHWGSTVFGPSPPVAGVGDSRAGVGNRR